MSTNALVMFAKREKGVSFGKIPERTTAQVYKHNDGGRRHLGNELCKILKNAKLESGITTGQRSVFNGPGDLAAHVITCLKTCSSNGVFIPKQGDVYLDQVGTDRGNVNYTYYIWSDYDKDVWISVFNVDGDCEFVGEPEALQTRYDN